MHKGHPITFQLFHNKAFATEHTGAQLALKFDTYTYTLRSAKEGVFLTSYPVAQMSQIKCYYLSCIRRSKIYFLLATSDVGKGGHKQALSNQNPLACRHELAQ